jgi:hypothetical protein
MHAQLLIVLCCLGQTPQPPAPKDTTPESVEVRYARAQLALAEANLKRVQQSNSKVARAVPGSVVDEYQNDVQVAKTRLAQATAGSAGNEFQYWLQRATAEQKAAETRWKNAVAANARVQGTFDPLDVERFRLRAEAAKLQVERGQALASAGREVQLQWELDLLDNQVQRLKEETSRATPYLRWDPVWGW